MLLYSVPPGKQTTCLESMLCYYYSWWCSSVVFPRWFSVFSSFQSVASRSCAEPDTVSRLNPIYTTHTLSCCFAPHRSLSPLMTTQPTHHLQRTHDTRFEDDKRADCTAELQVSDAVAWSGAEKKNGLTKVRNWHLYPTTFYRFSFFLFLS